MTLEECKKIFEKGIDTWRVEGTFSNIKFTRWVEDQEIEVLEFTRDVLIKHNWDDICDYIDAIINLKKLNKINENFNDINIGNQLN